MRFGEIGLILLVLLAFTGLYVVVSRAHSYQPVREDEVQEESTDPLDLLEADFATLCYGNEFRVSSSAGGDTLVRSMDLRDSISIRQANLFLTRSLARHGFRHTITYYDHGRGLTFVCMTPDGQPARLELCDILR